MKTITVVCEKHSGKPHIIVRLHHLDGEWSAFESYSAAARRRMNDSRQPDEDTGDAFERLLSGFERGDREVPVTAVGDGKAGASPVSTESGKTLAEDWHLTWDFTCPRCKRRNRHATVTRRQSKLFPVLDLLAANGIRQISVENLQAAFTSWDKMNR